MKLSRNIENIEICLTPWLEPVNNCILAAILIDLRKNPKKTWQLLKEAANLNKTSDSVEKLISGNETITDQG